MTKRNYIILLVALILITACNGGRGHIATDEEQKEVELLNDSGTVLRNRSNFSGALDAHEKALRLAEEYNDTTGMVVAYNNLGTDMRRLSNLDEAADYHLEAYRLSTLQYELSGKGLENRLKSMNGLGNIDLTIGNYDGAEVAFRNALEGEKIIKSDLGLAINYANIGSIKKQRGEIDSATYYYEKSMEYNRKAKSDLGIGLCHTYFGEVAEKKGLYNEAIDQYKKAYNRLLKTDDEWHLLEPVIALGRIYIQLNDNATASELLKQADKTAKDLGAMEYRASILKLLAKCSERSDDYREACAYHKLAQEVNDSLYDFNKIENLQKARIRYERNKNQQEKDAIQQQYDRERSKNENLWVIIIFSFLLTLGVIVVTFTIRRLQVQRTKYLREKMFTAQRNSEERKKLYDNITHEFRTPLTVIQGLTEQILSGEMEVKCPKVLASVEKINEQGNTMLTLINRILNIGDNVEEINAIFEQASENSGQPVADIDSQGKPVPTDDTEYMNDDERPCVLVVEDNSDIRNYVVSLLKDNYNVMQAVDGQEALEKMEDMMPDLIITDIMMPRMDGYELCRNVREKEDTYHIPIVVTTARIGEEDRMQGLNLGVDAYLTKPFKSQELLLHVHRLITQRQKLKETFLKLILSDSSPIDDATYNAKRAMIGEALNNNSNRLNSRDNAFIQDVHRSADACLARFELTPTDLADEMAMSYSQLNRRMKNITGMTVNTYIERLVVGKACKLLQTTMLPVGEIATQCGFNDNSYFSRVFKKVTGKTPSQYRSINEM